MKQETEKTTTIQATSKYWKSFSAVGVMLMIGSFMSMWLGMGIQPAIPFILGIIFYVYGRVGAWWNHA